MRITNKQGLPEPLVRAVSYSDRKRGDAEFTVTELVQPPRIGALTRQHYDEIEEDAADRLWLLMGSAGHEVLRRSSNGGIVEERCEVDVDGCKVSGQMDYIASQKSLTDYKFTSIYAVKEGVKPEWEQQLNSYRWLVKQYGIDIEKLEIIAIFRDWSKPESQRNRDYPQSQVLVMPVRIWLLDEAEAWIKDRIRLHRAARETLPLCTPDEMWEKPGCWAVKKKGNTRATKLHQTQLDAQVHASQYKDLEVEERPAQRPRCESYCAVSEFCSQFKQWKGQLL